MQSIAAVLTEIALGLDLSTQEERENATLLGKIREYCRMALWESVRYRSAINALHNEALTAPLKRIASLKKDAEKSHKRRCKLVEAALIVQSTLFKKVHRKWAETNFLNQENWYQIDADSALRLSMKAKGGN